MNEHSHLRVAIITGCSSGIGRATARMPGIGPRETGLYHEK